MEQTMRGWELQRMLAQEARGASKPGPGRTARAADSLPGAVWERDLPELIAAAVFASRLGREEPPKPAPKPAPAPAPKPAAEIVRIFGRLFAPPHGRRRKPRGEAWR